VTSHNVEDTLDAASRIRGEDESRQRGDRRTTSLGCRSSDPSRTPGGGRRAELALRSKAHWGYDADFLAACHDDLTLSPDDIATSTVYVFDGASAPAGFCRLVLLDDGVAELDALFVEPAAMGQGVGSRLWWHAVSTAAKLG
jgi:GNAT superfamily N-acetyltransferase